MTTSPKNPWLGIIATILGCLAVLAAVLPTWVLPLIQPPPPAGKVIVDTAQKVKDRVIAKAKGIEYKEPERKADWYRILAAAAMTLGAFAIVFAAISFVAHEPWRFAAAAATLGAGAVVFQFSLMVVFAIFGLVLIAIVCSAVGAIF